MGLRGALLRVRGGAAGGQVGKRQAIQVVVAQHAEALAPPPPLRRGVAEVHGVFQAEHRPPGLHVPALRRVVAPVAARHGAEQLEGPRAGAANALGHAQAVDEGGVPADRRRALHEEDLQPRRREAVGHVRVLRQRLGCVRRVRHGHALRVHLRERRTPDLAVHGAQRPVRQRVPVRRCPRPGLRLVPRGAAADDAREARHGVLRRGRPAHDEQPALVQDLHATAPAVAEHRAVVQHVRAAPQVSCRPGPLPLEA
mmetsp:Transcript_12726/g.38191  ORF Transcript_12726/g.38191 Transcript_12726/m.38191 type:complete len:255 (+) Transcript_12726:2081-2845(+)